MTALKVTEAELPALAAAADTIRVLEQQILARAQEYARILKLSFPRGDVQFERLDNISIDMDALYAGGHIIPVTVRWSDARDGGFPKPDTVELPRQFLFDTDGTYTTQVKAFANRHPAATR